MKKHKVLLAIVFVFLMFMPAQSLAESQLVTKTVRDFVGEEHLYGIAFLFFDRLGEGELRFAESDQPGIFRAELVGRTLGIASWLSGNRTQTYTSTMQLMPDGSLNSIEYVSKVRKRKKGQWRRYSKVCQFDCATGKILEEKIVAGAVVSSEEHDVPAGKSPVDILTAFYNLRLGVYGAVERGKTIFIPTFSTKGFSEIEIQVLTVAEHLTKKYFPRHGMLIKAIVDPEVFETKNGSMYVWFDDKGSACSWHY